MPEKLCLQWNNFKDNVNKAFGNLREDPDFSDVTLACEDGHQFEAHKVILAASSPFFKRLLVQNKHGHPLIFMRGVKPEDLKAVLDFLYYGEANVLQENLDFFLTIASELKLTGLTDGEGSQTFPRTSSPLESPKPDSKNITPEQNSQSKESFYNEEIHSGQISSHKMEDTTVAKMDDLPAYLAELDQKVKSLMEKSQKVMPLVNGKRQTANICKVCGKEGQIVAIRDHIEANHLEGVSLPCNLCEKTFSSRQTLRLHKNSHNRM